MKLIADKYRRNKDRLIHKFNNKIIELKEKGYTNSLRETLASRYFIVLMFAAKMMVYYSLIDANRLEILLILISILVMGILFICFGKSDLKRKHGIFLTVYFLLSLLMFADTMYYNYYNQTVSIRQLWQAKSVTAVPKSFIDTLIPASFLLFVDIPFAYRYFKKYSFKIKAQQIHWRREIKLSVAALAGILLSMIANPFSFAAVESVSSMEFFTSHINDIWETITENISVQDMKENEILEVLQRVENSKDNTARYHGIGKGKNLIVIQLEAFQNFVLNKKYEGQEITPNINALLKENTLYYDTYYSNVGKGNTVDAEFSSMNSLYPSKEGESYRLFGDNTYHGLPWLMREQGYTAFAVHGYEGTFWSREKAYPNQGFQDFISMEDLNQDELIGLGISDKSLFKQLIPILKKQKTPFFSFAITLTNHHPFELAEEYRTLTLAEEDKDTKFGNYLETVRYTDEAIGQLINDLKAEGLYENTVIALYGDHHGLNCNMDEVSERMSRFIGRTYDYDEMMQVPLIIHVPGSGVKETIHTTGGQIDFLPTIANIIGLPLDNTFILGQDLTNAKNGFVAFTSYLLEGSFAQNDAMFQISREGIFEGSRAWRIGTGEVLDASLYQKGFEKAALLKRISKQILEQNIIGNYVTH